MLAFVQRQRKFGNYSLGTPILAASDEEIARRDGTSRAVSKMHAFIQRKSQVNTSVTSAVLADRNFIGAGQQDSNFVGAGQQDTTCSLQRLQDGKVITRKVANQVHPRKGKKSRVRHRSVQRRASKEPKPSLFEWVQQRRQQSMIKSKSSCLQGLMDGHMKGKEISRKRDAVEADLQCTPSVKYVSVKKPYVAHFIFLDIGLGKLSDHPLYEKNIEEFRRFNPNSGVMVWGENEVNDLVQQQYPQLIEMWNRFPSKWYHIDFARYLILHTHGGIYIDMDMQCIQELPERGRMDFIDKDDEYPHKSSKTIRFCNNIICFRDETLYGKLIQFSLERLQTMKIPQTWKRRMMLYKVGARMYHVFCRNNNLQRTAVRDYFYNHRTWSLYKVPFSETGQMHIGTI